MRRYGIFLCVILLGVMGGLRDAFDDWVDRTDLPALVAETSVEVTARDGSLLRAFTVADGRWRLDPGPVDPLFLQMRQQRPFPLLIRAKPCASQPQPYSSKRNQRQ